MYHHFAGKSQLAAASLRRDAEILRRSTAELLASGKSPIEAVVGYLRVPRPPLMGCKLGRMTYDPDVVADDEMRSPIAETFTFYQGRIAALLDEGQRSGRAP
jgi:AcrR family transcriptional regulator